MPGCRHDIHKDIEGMTHITDMHDAAERFDPRAETVFKFLQVGEGGPAARRGLAPSLDVQPIGLLINARRAHYRTAGPVGLRHVLFPRR